MMDNWSTRGDAIDLSEPYEVRQLCSTFGCSEAQLRDAVRLAGRSAAAVVAYLRSAGNHTAARRAA